MRTATRAAVIWGVTAIIFLGTWASRAWAFEFSGERLTKDRGKLVSAQVYAKHDRWRLEYAEPQSGVMVAIVRRDRQIAWRLFSRLRVYLEGPIANEQLLFVNENMEGEVSRELIGTETLHGVPTELFEVTVEREGQREQYYQWVPQAQRFAIKTVSKRGDHSLEYRNVIFAEQPVLYFELPIGYERGNPG